jgi:hypothetical protein
MLHTYYYGLGAYTNCTVFNTFGLQSEDILKSDTKRLAILALTS